MSNFYLILLVVILFFLIGREFFSWYFKVNQIVGLLEDIKENTSHDVSGVVKNKVRIFRDFNDNPVDKDGNLVDLDGNILVNKGDSKI